MKNTFSTLFIIGVQLHLKIFQCFIFKNYELSQKMTQFLRETDNYNHGVQY